MRLWSINPAYLDRMGLVALWREGLLALSVINNKSSGYSNHSQLIRFKESEKPVTYLNDYMHYVCDEAKFRGYNFDRSKLSRRSKDKSELALTVSYGQIEYESKRLLYKLKQRAKSLYNTYMEDIGNETGFTFMPHPMFHVVEGSIESWEKINHSEMQKVNGWKDGNY